MTKSKAYISGQITGLPIKEAKANFKAAEERLIAQGYEVVNPMELPEHEPIINSGGTDYERWVKHMKVDIKAMMDCDTIAVQPNSIRSKGATIECGLAFNLGFTTIYL